MTDLGTLGGTFSQANGVNKNGKVAGFSHTPSIVNHGIVWTVTP
jgi:uncharacterized membrane protein